MTGIADCGEHNFEKPYFTTLMMFLGEALCLVIFKSYRYYQKYQERQASFSANTNSFPDAHYASLSPGRDAVIGPLKVRPPLYYFAGFCTFDMIATIVSGMGLIWVDASLYQMIRGAQLVFAALASMVLVGKRYTCRQWLAVATVVVGLAAVGVSGLLKASHDGGTGASTSEQLLGIYIYILFFC